MIRKTFSAGAKDCYRTPLSGGHHEKGDIVMGEALRRRFPYLVECKHSKAWTLAHVLPMSKLMNQWLEQTFEEAKIEQRTPLLVLRGNYTTTYVVVPKTQIHGFRLHNTLEHLQFYWRGKALVMMIFEDFLARSKSVE